MVNHHQLSPEIEDRSSPVPTAGWPLVCLFLLASAWGLSELIGGETVWLTAVALLLLATARALVNRPGSSTAMAAIAVLFKSVNTAPFICHLAGIALLGIAFDIAATLLWRNDRKRFLRAGLTGVIGTYLSCFLFAFTMVWIIKYRYWASGGFDLVGEYTLSSGSRGALTGLLIVPVGLWLGRLLAGQAVGHRRAVMATTVAACLALWVVGPFIP